MIPTWSGASGLGALLLLHSSQRQPSIWSSPDECSHLRSGAQRAWEFPERPEGTELVLAPDEWTFVTQHVPFRDTDSSPGFSLTPF